MAEVDTNGLLALLSPRTLRVAGHFLELDLDADGDLTGWRLLCGGCLAPRVDLRLCRPADPRPGLPLDGALRLPGSPGWPAATLAWGLVGHRCDHARASGHPVREARNGRMRLREAGSAWLGPRACRANRVVFVTGWRKAVESDPVLVPGGLWVSVAEGHATRVHTDAFGVRHPARRPVPSWQECPA